MGMSKYLAQGAQAWWPFSRGKYSTTANSVAIICSLQYFDMTEAPMYCQDATGINDPPEDDE
jgi:hypothetical protein